MALAYLLSAGLIAECLIYERRDVESKGIREIYWSGMMARHDGVEISIKLDYRAERSLTKLASCSSHRLQIIKNRFEMRRDGFSELIELSFLHAGTLEALDSAGQRIAWNSCSIIAIRGVTLAQNCISVKIIASKRKVSYGFAIRTTLICRAERTTGIDEVPITIRACAGGKRTSRVDLIWAAG